VIIYRHTKPGKWIQILKDISIIYCSASGTIGILCYLAVTYCKFLFRDNDSGWKVVVKVFIRYTDAKLVLYELLF